MVDDVMSNGEPKAIQHDIDMMQVEAPSLMTIQKTLFPITRTWIETKASEKDKAHSGIHQML